MKNIIIVSFALLFAMNICAAKKSKVTPLQFNPDNGVKASLTMTDGKVVNYTAYTKLYFVTNVEDSTYQYMNIFVPEGATHQSPMFLRTYVGGYMASEAGYPQAQDASGRALAGGLCACHSWQPWPYINRKTGKEDHLYRSCSKSIARSEGSSPLSSSF